MNYSMRFRAMTLCSMAFAAVALAGVSQTRADWTINGTGMFTGQPWSLNLGPNGATYNGHGLFSGQPFEINATPSSPSGYYPGYHPGYVQPAPHPNYYPTVDPGYHSGYYGTLPAYPPPYQTLPYFPQPIAQPISAW